MKEKLIIPAEQKGDLWLYNRERFLDHSYQSFLHRHDELELNLVLRGKGTYLLNDHTIELAPGSLLWLFPEQEHILMDRSLDFEMWILVIRPEYLAELCRDAGSQVLLEGNPGGDFSRGLAGLQFQKLAGLCKDAAGIKAGSAFFNVSLGYLLLSAWAAYQNAASRGKEKKISPAIEKAARLILDGKAGDDLDELARTVGLSAGRLSRLFKSQVGVPLTGFRNRKRIELFLDLYGNGQERTLLDAALEAGFGSYAQFYRVFKQVMGGTPNEYRNRR
jgi:AraC-like DNA-binding protein